MTDHAAASADHAAASTHPTALHSADADANAASKLVPGKEGLPPFTSVEPHNAVEHSQHSPAWVDTMMGDAENGNAGTSSRTASIPSDANIC